MDLKVEIAIAIAMGIVVIFFIARLFRKATHIEKIHVQREEGYASDDLDRLIGDIKNQADKKKGSQ